MLLIFLLRLALCLWALADGNLWRACAFHTVWNRAPTALGSGDRDNAAGDAAGLDGAIVATVVSVLLPAVAGALWCYPRSVREGKRHAPRTPSLRGCPGP